MAEQWSFPTADPPPTSDRAHHGSVPQTGHLRRGHSERNGTVIGWNILLRREEHSGAGIVVGDQGDWTDVNRANGGLKPGHLLGSLTDRNSEGESLGPWLLTGAPL
jgi:hypothetical protein